MPKSVVVPQIVHHKASGRDVVFLRQPDGSRSMVYLGPHGAPEVERRHKEVLADYLAGKPLHVVRQKERPSTFPTVGQLVAAFLLDQQRLHVGPDGKPTRRVVHLQHAMAPLLAMFRDQPTDRFTVANLLDVRQSIVDAEFGHQTDDEGRPIAGTGKRRCRSYVNELVSRIKLVFRWGVERNMVPGEVSFNVRELLPLPIGRSGARESEQVEAVPLAAVDAIMPHLPPTLQAAVRLQWWTGMRPGEVLQLRMVDIDRSGERWTFRPKQHKGIWRGLDRLVVIGPRARAILETIAKANPRAYLINPADAMVERKEAWRAERVSKVPPSQQSRDKGRRVLRDRYDVAAYRRAIARACELAGVEHWSPHQLRHAAGARFTIDAGSEAARIALGHRDDRMTKNYARSAEHTMAVQVASEHG